MEQNIASEQDSYNEPCYYTPSRGDSSFIHQHVVDAFVAQNSQNAVAELAGEYEIV